VLLLTSDSSKYRGEIPLSREVEYILKYNKIKYVLQKHVKRQVSVQNSSITKVSRKIVHVCVEWGGRGETKEQMEVSRISDSCVWKVFHSVSRKF
jgi:hypothetical protein